MSRRICSACDLPVDGHDWDDERRRQDDVLAKAVRL